MKRLFHHCLCLCVCVCSGCVCAVKGTVSWKWMMKVVVCSCGYWSTSPCTTTPLLCLEPCSCSSGTSARDRKCCTLLNRCTTHTKKLFLSVDYLWTNRKPTYQPTESCVRVGVFVLMSVHCLISSLVVIMKGLSSYREICRDYFCLAFGPLFFKGVFWTYPVTVYLSRHDKKCTSDVTTQFEHAHCWCVILSEAWRPHKVTFLVSLWLVFCFSFDFKQLPRCNYFTTPAQNGSWRIIYHHWVVCWFVQAFVVALSVLSNMDLAWITNSFILTWFWGLMSKLSWGESASNLKAPVQSLFSFILTLP